MQRIYQSPITSGIQPKGKVITNNKRDVSTFKAYLKDQVNELKISKHAGARLAERNINIDKSTWERISIKLSEANEKGIKDSLVLVGEAALVVNTENNTVITAMNRKEASDHIFSNINGAIVLN